MASPPPSQQKSSNSWSGYLSTLGFWRSQEQHESSLQDDQFRISSVDPEPKLSIHRNIPSTSVKINSKSELGKGAFARVYVGCLLDRDEEECAFKVFNDKVLGDDVEKEFKRMHDLKHPNIVRVYGMIPAYKIKGRNAFVIVMELCDMSLDQYIKERFKRGISKVKLLQILHGIASAMIYLHDQDMVHGDLRSPNVLVKESPDSVLVKVTDFGMTGCLNEAGELMTTTFADSKYLPPEVFMNNSTSGSKKNRVKLSKKVDVFCFGPIGIEVGCGEFPEPTAKSETKRRTVVKTFSEIERREKHIKKVKKVHSECIELIVQQCMQDKPEERASFPEILQTIEWQSKKRPDSELLEEKQHEIEDLRAQMETNQEAMEEYKRCANQNLKKKLLEEDTLKRKAEELEHDLSVKDRKLCDLEEEARKQSEGFESAQFKIIGLEGEVSNLHRLNEEAKKQANDELLKKGKALKELEKQKQAISQERDHFHKDCESKNKEIEVLQGQVRHKDLEMQALSRKKDTLISQLENLCQDHLGENKQQQKYYSEQEKKLKREVEEAKSALEERNRRVETLTNQLEEGADATAVTQQYEEEKKRLEESFKEKEKSLRDEIDEMTRKKKCMIEETNRLQKKYNLLAKEQDELVADRDELNSKFTELGAKNFQLQSDVDSLQGKYDELRAERDSLENERCQLNSRLSELEAKNNQLQSERESITADKDSLQGEYGKLKIERDHLEHKRGHLESKMNELIGEVGKGKEEKEALRAYLNALEAEKTQLKKKMKDLEAERDDLTSERDALKTVRDSLERDRSMIHAQKKQLESEKGIIIQTTTAEKRQLKDEIKQARDFIVQWLNNNKSENKVYAESSLKNMLLSVHDAHCKQVRCLKEEGEASLKVVADKHAVNWQTALDKQQEKDREIQQLQRLLQEKETCMQKLTQEQSRSKEEYLTLQSSWQKLSNKKAALEQKLKTASKEDKVTEEEKNSGERAEEESKKIKGELAELRDKLTTLQKDKADLKTTLQTTQNSLHEKTEECKREHKFAIDQQKKVKKQEEENNNLKEQLSKTKADFQAQGDCLLNCVSNIQRAFDRMQCNEVTTTLTGHIELMTCRLGKLDLKLKEQHMASETVIAANNELKGTCKVYENHNTRLRRKLTEAIHKEEELTKAWEEERSAFEEKLSHCEKRLGLSKKKIQEKDETIDGLVKSVQEKDALYNDTKIKLSNANTHSEHLEEENKRLRSTVETFWGRISELDEDKKRQTGQIDALEATVKEKHSKLLDCQEKYRISEEEWNTKLAEKKKLIAFLATELSLAKEDVQDLQSQLEAREVVHNELLKCVENEYKLKLEELQKHLTHLKNQRGTLRVMVSRKDHELQEVCESLIDVRSIYEKIKIQCNDYENQCATLWEKVSCKEQELQDVREDLAAVKRSCEKIKTERDQYEDAQLGLQEKVQELEQYNKTLEEKVCRDESHLMLRREKGSLEAQLTILEDAYGKVLAEKLKLQISHDCLAKALEQKTPGQEEEKKQLERIRKKQEKHYRDRCGKLILSKAELKAEVQSLEVEKAKFQDQKKLYEAVKKLPEECRKEWRELQEEYRQSSDRKHQELAMQQQKEFTQCLKDMNEQHKKHSLQLVKSEPHSITKFSNFNYEAMKEFMILYVLLLRQPEWACDNVNTGHIMPEKHLSQLCEVGSFIVVSTGSLFCKNSKTSAFSSESTIHSECPSAVRDFVIRIHRPQSERHTHGSRVTEAGSACSFTFLRSKDKVYLCHLLIAKAKMIAPDKRELESDILHFLVKIALHDNFGEEMQRAANKGNISKGVIYDPIWHGREPPVWSRDIPWESLPEKAKPVVKQLQLEAVRELEKRLTSWMDRIPNET